MTARDGKSLPPAFAHCERDGDQQERESARVAARRARCHLPIVVAVFISTHISIVGAIAVGAISAA